jgi:hypothetical protein
MIQTIAVVVLLLADVTLALLHYPHLLRVARLFPNVPAVGITHIALFTAVGAAFLLIGLAGFADRIVFMRRVRTRLEERDATLHAMGDEVLRMKAVCYDQERPPLADVQARLDAIEQGLRALLTSAGSAQDAVGIAVDHDRAQVPLEGHT